jgi:lipopolysaccharide transport system ATP-binding protein
MSDTVIRVENLSKKYIIRHQQAQQYTALRDVIADGVKSIGRRLSGVKQDPSMGSTQEEFWALKDVSFEVKQGDRIGIIGRNGAGKSTLLKILSRITEPTKGKVMLNGRVASLLEVGTGFHPELTGRENIYLNGAILGMGKAEIKKKFDEIFDFSEVEKFIDTPVKHYSSGMYVRLAFAVAAHLDPEILIVDEVLAVGDAQFQKKCLGKLGDISDKEGRTVIFVSHNMAAMENLCLRGIVLNQGNVISDQEILKAISQYYQTTQASHESSLKNRIDRQGNGKVRLVDIKIYNQDIFETNTIRMGESFQVVLKTEGKARKAIIGIHFGNIYRPYLIRGYTREQVKDEITLTGEDLITCKFYDFPMMHGNYDVQIWIGTYPPSECFDYVERATVLEVMAKDIFQTGIMPDALGGIAFCQCSWTINGL